MHGTVSTRMGATEMRKVLLWKFYESLPTSSLWSAEGCVAFGLALLAGAGARVFLSSPEESAVLRRFSTGEDTEEVLRLLLPAGSYLGIERCLFLSLRLSGLGLLLKARRIGLLPRSRLELRLRLRLRRRSSWFLWSLR